jgi:hypothetical protein
MSNAEKKKTVRQLLSEYPDVVRYGERIKEAIVEKKISLKATPAEIVQRAYDYERRGIEGSIERFLEEEDQRAQERFEKKFAAEKKK